LPRTLVKSSSFFFASFSRCWEGSVSCWRTICVLDNASRLYEEECNISSPCGHTERSPLCILLLHAPSMFLLHFSSSRAGGGREGLAVTVEQKISCLIPYFFQATLHMLGGTTRCRVIFTRPFIEFVFPFLILLFGFLTLMLEWFTVLKITAVRVVASLLIPPLFLLMSRFRGHLCHACP
jgi:hypothetical protein